MIRVNNSGLNTIPYCAYSIVLELKSLAMTVYDIKGTVGSSIHPKESAFDRRCKTKPLIISHSCGLLPPRHWTFPPRWTGWVGGSTNINHNLS